MIQRELDDELCINSLWHTGGTPVKFDNGSATNFHQGVQSLWRGGLSHNLLEDFNNDRKGWGNKVRIT